jgi:hypothetical protein
MDPSEIPESQATNSKVRIPNLRIGKSGSPRFFRLLKHRIRKRNPYSYLDLWNVSPEAEVGDNAAHQHDHQLTQEQQEVANAAQVKETVTRDIYVIYIRWRFTSTASILHRRDAELPVQRSMFKKLGMYTLHLINIKELSPEMFNNESFHCVRQVRWTRIESWPVCS